MNFLERTKDFDRFPEEIVLDGKSTSLCKIDHEDGSYENLSFIDTQAFHYFLLSVDGNCLREGEFISYYDVC